MADQSSEDKTEKASSEKLRKARQQGQVARSRDWASAVGIVVCVKVIVLLTPGYLDDFRTLFALGFVPLDGDGTLENLWSALFTATLLLLVKMVLPLFIVPLVVSLCSLFPGGWVLSIENIMPKMERLSALGYFKRLCEPKHVAELLISIAKAATLGAVLWYLARHSRVDYMSLQAMPLDQALLCGAALMVDGVMAMCSVFVVFAFIDLPIQHFIYARGQRMGKNEMKEEHKSAEGRPEVRQRIRQVQQQIARRSLRQTVPTANVIVVNPEHYAVALKYDEARADAPFVVAKGVDEMALYIRQLAAEHAIDIVALPPLARAIYNTSQVNQQIPAPLFRAVAAVLGYVLQLKAFRSGQRQAPPPPPDNPPVPQQFLDAYS